MFMADDYLRSRIQCSTGPLWPFELEQAMDALAAAEFSQIEVMVTREPKTQDPALVKKLVDERGLSVASVHGPYLAITKNVWGMDPIQKTRRGVEMCRALGASTLIVHPPYLWEQSFASWLTKESQAFGEGAGVKIAVETMYPKWVAGRKARAHRWLDPIELVEKAPWVVIDTSHLTVARKDILRALNVLMPKLVHVHLSNNAGDGRDGHLELEKGILPIDRFLNELRRSRYEEAVSLELSVSKYIDSPGELVGMLKRNREYVESRLTGEARMAKGLPRS
jgi:sugar phosphate isomerase/epimerase